MNNEIYEYSTIIANLPTGDVTIYGNLKARLRMTILYYFANKLNYLVLGTSNKTELRLGYFTKFGDGASDLLPIGDMTKDEVYKLARRLNIPSVILNKAPSAGLWPGQTDEKDIGFPYSILDTAGYPEMNILGKKDKTKISNMMKNAQHKLKMPEIYRKNEY